MDRLEFFDEMEPYEEVKESSKILEEIASGKKTSEIAEDKTEKKEIKDKKVTPETEEFEKRLLSEEPAAAKLDSKPETETIAEAPPEPVVPVIPDEEKEIMESADIDTPASFKEIKSKAPDAPKPDIVQDLDSQQAYIDQITSKYEPFEETDPGVKKTETKGEVDAKEIAEEDLDEKMIVEETEPQKEADAYIKSREDKMTSEEVEQKESLIAEKPPIIDEEETEPLPPAEESSGYIYEEETGEMKAPATEDEKITIDIPEGTDREDDVYIIDEQEVERQKSKEEKDYIQEPEDESDFDISESYRDTDSYEAFKKATSEDEATQLEEMPVSEPETEPVEATKSEMPEEYIDEGMITDQRLGEELPQFEKPTDEVSQKIDEKVKESGGFEPTSFDTGEEPIEKPYEEITDEYKKPPAESASEEPAEDIQAEKPPADLSPPPFIEDQVLEEREEDRQKEIADIEEEKISIETDKAIIGPPPETPEVYTESTVPDAFVKTEKDADKSLESSEEGLMEEKTGALPPEAPPIEEAAKPEDTAEQPEGIEPPAPEMTTTPEPVEFEEAPATEEKEPVSKTPFPETDRIQTPESEQEDAMEEYEIMLQEAKREADDFIQDRIEPQKPGRDIEDTGKGTAGDVVLDKSPPDPGSIPLTSPPDEAEALQKDEEKDFRQMSPSLSKIQAASAEEVKRQKMDSEEPIDKPPESAPTEQPTDQEIEDLKYKSVPLDMDEKKEIDNRDETLRTFLSRFKKKKEKEDEK